jgi:hypothetical protein
MTDRGQLDFLDLISIASFVIALQNLDLNVTQEDAQALQRALSEKTDLLLDEIHRHLEEQDFKLSNIETLLKEINNGSK